MLHTTNQDKQACMACMACMVFGSIHSTIWILPARFIYVLCRLTVHVFLWIYPICCCFILPSFYHVSTGQFSTKMMIAWIAWWSIHSLFYSENLCWSIYVKKHFTSQAISLVQWFASSLRGSSIANKNTHNSLLAKVPSRIASCTLSCPLSDTVPLWWPVPHQ